MTVGVAIFCSPLSGWSYLNPLLDDHIYRLELIYPLSIPLIHPGDPPTFPSPVETYLGGCGSASGSGESETSGDVGQALDAA